MLLLSLFSSLFPFHHFLLHPLHFHHQHPSLYWLLFLTIFFLYACHRITPTWHGTHTPPVLYLRMSTSGCPNYDTFLKYACFGHTQKGEFPLGFSAEKLLRFAAAKKSSDKQLHFFEGALPVQTHFQISTRAIFSGVKKWILCSQFC